MRRGAEIVSIVADEASTISTARRCGSRRRTSLAAADILEDMVLPNAARIVETNQAFARNTEAMGSSMYDNLLAECRPISGSAADGADSYDGSRFDVFDPATENLIASVASATVQDAADAVDAAQDAFGPWLRVNRVSGQKSSARRMSLSCVTRSVCEAHHLENGKALPDSRRRSRTPRILSGGMRKNRPQYRRCFGRSIVRRAHLVHHRPAGVAAPRNPMDYPAAMATRKIARLSPPVAQWCSKPRPIRR